MERRRVALGKAKPLALDGLDVQQHGAADVADLGEGRDQGGQVVAVDRPDADVAEVLEHVTVADHRLEHLAAAVVDLFEDRPAREPVEHHLAPLLPVVVRRADADAVEVLGHRALGGADGHAVVVEDGEELALQRAGVVEALERDAVDDGRVADERDGAAVGLTFAACEHVVAPRHAHRGANRGAGVPDAEQIELALARLGEPRHPLGGPQLIEQPQPTGQQLVRVTLVPDVEEQPVVAEIEDEMQGDGQLDHAEVGREVAPGAADLFADRVADLLGELRELVDVEPLEVGRAVQGREEGIGHGVAVV